MEMNELKQMIDERAQKQIEAAKESIKSELGAVPQAQLDEAVNKAVAQIMEKAKKDEAENVKYLEAFKEAVCGNGDVKVRDTSHNRQSDDCFCRFCYGQKRRSQYHAGRPKSNRRTGKERLPVFKRLAQGFGAEGS